MRFQPQSLTPDRSARHFLGGELRRHREVIGLSLVQLAKIVNSSKSTLARVETAELMPPPDLPAKLDLAFGLDGFFARIYNLARREAHPDQYRRYMDFEAEATVIEQYAAHVLPGLLQTERYARAFLGCQPDLTVEELDERVAARMARQDRLRAGTPPYRWAVLDESVLRRPVGGADVMREQLTALMWQVDSQHSKIQVATFSIGAHALLGGSLTLLTLPDGSTSSYEEGIDAGHLHEDAATVQKQRRLYDVLRANALSLADSAALIRKVLEDYKTCDRPPT
jgi:transcriptional regulator with XRE-family HTH domain